YATVRIRSILAKAAARGLQAGSIQLSNSYDSALALELTRLPLILSQVHQKKTPHLLCEYLFQLAQSFSAFYQHCNIVREADSALQGSWLSLVELCLKTLNLGLELLGIEAPERM
ncbi:MAG: DALR anticodon-binding domain-containing protein, partial [Myxococcota bacterium]|nr:DALR anticodon-binding domain-containing protein [Myxococcota bacterium]